MGAPSLPVLTLWKEKEVNNQLVIKAILWSQRALKSTNCLLCVWLCAEPSHLKCPEDSQVLSLEGLGLGILWTLEMAGLST